MLQRNWLDLSRKLVDRFDMNTSFTAVQQALGDYALAWFGEGVVTTSVYPNPFPFTMSGSGLGGTVGNGIAFDYHGILTSISPSTTSPKTFTLAAANPSLSRYDLVCIKYLSAGDTPVPKPSDPLTTVFLNLHDDFQLVVITGTPSGSPVYPAKGDPALIVLAGIQVPAAATLGTQCTIDYSQREIANENLASFPVVVQETPGGDIDGSNTLFSISQAPVNTTSILVKLDGLTLRQGIEWSIVGQILTLNPAPAIGQALSVWYIVNSSNSQNPLTGAQEVPFGTCDGSTTTFDLSGKPANQASTLVFVDGVESPLTDWSLVQGPTHGSILFNGGAIPQTGQNVYVFYLVNPFVFGSQPPSPNLTNAISLGSGHVVLAGVVGGVAQFKTLVQGANMTITEDATTVTFAASGGGGGSGAYTTFGNFATPVTITAGGGISPSGDARQLYFVKSSGGAVVVTKNPQIDAGTTVGQEVTLSGTSATNYPIFQDGTGLSLNGPINLTDNGAIALVWNGSVWVEISRR